MCKPLLTPLGLLSLSLPPPSDLALEPRVRALVTALEPRVLLATDEEPELPLALLPGVPTILVTPPGVPTILVTPPGLGAGLSRIDEHELPVESGECGECSGPAPIVSSIGPFPEEALSASRFWSIIRWWTMGVFSSGLNTLLLPDCFLACRRSAMTSFI
jgi:hypothetical protein